VAILGAILGCCAWWLAPTPVSFQSDAAVRAMDQLYEKATPLEAWVHWHRDLVPLAESGLAEMEMFRSGAEARGRQRLLTYRNAAFGLAGCGLLIAVTAAVWKSRV
jgi:hypothetical protein